ncbi:LamB/YcsF family protein [Bacillus massiliglaciei]|uniref:LamB/YcsF family protein n=1 Tax=Bacillus massiliglaciei TaxID=1816693 RepID=UPI002D2197D9|nr:5-oxoprolinase subunit PxpA [Bacillus massiliglaciei]
MDLNCDMGESFGLYELGRDEEMMQYITSANIACGYHAGDPQIMGKTVAMAKEHQVAIGAHPSFPDLLGFGRRRMNATPAEIKDYVIYQLGALQAFAKLHGVKVQHCKPHGALYMMAMEEEDVAKAILEGLYQINPDIAVFAMNRSAVEEVGSRMGMRIVKEVYSDREHTKSGSIVLTRKGPLIEDYEALAQRVVRMVKDGKVRTDSGEDTDLTAETVCIHGDTPGAVQLAKAIRKALAENDILVSSIHGRSEETIGR